VTAPGPAPPTLPDGRLSVLSGDVTSAALGGRIRHAITTRDLVSMDVDVRSNNSPDMAIDLDQRRGSIRLDHQVSRHTSVRVEYVRRAAVYGEGFTSHAVRSDDLAAGFEHAWRHSRTRQTTVGIAAGPSIVDTSTRRFTRIGAVMDIAHQLNKTWTVKAAYRRGVESTFGYGDATLSDSGTAAVTGLLAQHVAFNATSALSVGRVGLDAVDNKYQAFTSAARVTVAVTSEIAAYGEFVVYRSRFGRGAPLPPYYARQVDWQGPRFGMTLSIPFVSAGAGR